ncbi:DUF1223 domain-containing protein [Pelagicoccus sp. SDUM812003]|uniref:DUF1223 domain-containing protein n=1 Tax=Pelagicoccus sp. SDUM812003 TaxID=3041267 RepID=UPI00281033C7|nr:DUF1223 domain-containing protein [Pelagicoccus sp. SDUM812003]MDQ8202761.1 DUF1223 domain-containing protein [Pelagicoccus sp. SDUM812003]
MGKLDRLLAFILIALVLWARGVEATEEVFSSGRSQARLVELFTSQGCSSCPPAESRLNELMDSPGLWTDVVPVAFHVSYWDRLGWKDPFANKRFTQRQYAYRSAGRVGSVYTPCFVVDGAEWRGYFSGEALPRSSEDSSGTLVARVADERVTVEYDGSDRATDVKAAVAILGVGLETEVRRGENRNRTLRQEFVALSLAQGPLRRSMSLPKRNAIHPADRYAIAVWVYEEGSLRVLQATGGWLSDW